MLKNIILVLLLLSLCICTGYGINITSIQILDSLRNPKTSFSNTETITLKIDCFIDSPVDRVDFRFYIYDPAGARVFYHEGNSIVGRIGFGGSELKNIPINFYTRPGEYTFKGEIIPVTGNVPGRPVSQSIKFSIYSPTILLTYPPNGATDIPAQPLIFRWVSSGAPKYKIYVDDDASFYKPLWIQETILTEIEYPKEPADPLAKLRSGTVYWWKVEGIDHIGRIVATTAIPFSFSIKEATLISKDLAIENILLDELSTPELVKINVQVKNLGTQTESEIPIDIFVVPGGAIPAQRISIIQPGETKKITFDCGEIDAKTITVTATLNIFDDDPKNNSLTRVIKLIERAKILGRVTEKDTKGAKSIPNATVVFTGPLSGSVETDHAGRYKIENLRLGSYEIKVSHKDYKDSKIRFVLVDRHKAYPNIDFELETRPVEPVKPAEPVEPVKPTEPVKPIKPEEPAEPVKPAEPVEPVKPVEVPELTPHEVWTIIKEIIKDKKLEEQLKGFNLIEIELHPEGDISQIIFDLKTGRAKIIEYKIE